MVDVLLGSVDVLKMEQVRLWMYSVVAINILAMPAKQNLGQKVILKKVLMQK